MRGLKFSLLFLLLSLVFIAPQNILAADIPAIKSVLPKKVVAGSNDLRVRIIGKNKYKKGAVILVNGVAVDTQRQNGTLLGIIPANLLTQVGTVTLAVKIGTSVSSNGTLSIVNPTDVTISAIRPKIVIAGDNTSAFGVEVQGNNFKGNAIVRVGGFKTTSLVKRKGELSFIIGTVDPAEVTFNGSVPVQVENGDGTISNTFNIIITPPGPNISDITPSSTDIGSKPMMVQITGANFTDDSKVFVNGQLVPSTPKKGKKTTELDAMLSADFFTQIGQLPIKVVTPGVGDSETLLFDVTPPGKTPLIFSLDPSNIVAGTTTDREVIVLGANLSDIKIATFNGTKIPKEQITEITKRAVKIVVKAKSLSSPTTLNLQITTKGGTTNTIPLVVEPAATVNTILGSLPGFSDGSGKNALLANPSQVAFAPDGTLYIADQANNAIRKFDINSGQLSTIAGDPTGIPGFVDSDELTKDITTTRFNNPIGIAVDRDGTIYVTDFGNECVRRLRQNTQGTFTVDTVAGKSRMAKNDDGTKERVGEIGFLDDIPSRAVFSGPYGIAIDLDGNLLVSDSFNNVIRKVNIQNGEATSVSTVVGNGFPGLSDGAGTSVQFNKPLGLIVKDSTLFVSDFANNSIRQVDMASTNVQVLVGLRRRLQSNALGQTDSNSPTFGDGNKFFAVLSGPISLSFDSLGNLYVLDYTGNRIRRVTPAGVVTTVVGGTRGFLDGTATKVAFRDPRYMLMIDDKTIMVVDSGNHRIRKVFLP